MSEDLVQQWMKQDPYLMDSEGFQKFLEQKNAEALAAQLEAQKPKPVAKERKEKVVSYRTESQQWFKDLEELADRMHGGKDLANRIHEDILVKGEQFTQENASAFQEGTALLGKLLMIHTNYVETQQKVWTQDAFGGKWGDMFGEWLIMTGRLNVRGGQLLTPPHVAHFMAELLMGDNKEELEGKPKLICDPASGTGRFMLETAEHYAETTGKLNFIFVNIDIDFQVYVYCTMNAILNGIPAIMIWGNSLGSEKDYNEAVVTIPVGTVAMWRMVKKEDIPAALARLQYFHENSGMCSPEVSSE